MTGNRTDRSQTRRRGPSYPDRIIENARSLRRAGLAPAQIKQRLEAESGADLPGGDVPESTIKYWIRNVRQDASGAWHLWEAAAGTDPDPVLTAAWLGAIRWATYERVSYLTNKEARWITLLVRLGATGSRSSGDEFISAHLDVYNLARRFIEAERAHDEVALERLQRIACRRAADHAWPELDFGAEPDLDAIFPPETWSSWWALEPRGAAYSPPSNRRPPVGRVR